MELHYRKIGAIVYAANRLRTVIEQLEHNFNVKNSGATQLDPLQKLNFLNLVKSFHDQQKNANSISELSEVELDEQLKELQQIHYSLATIIEKVGMSEISSEGLKAQGRTLTFPRE